MSDFKLTEAIKKIKLPATTGQDIKISDFKGKAVVLYFYPKDNTPGCTLESQDFRDHYQSFLKQNAVILGISRDTLASHDKFITKQCLPFPLLADCDEKFCSAFEVLKEKTMFGKKVFGIERSTFLIDKEGKLAKTWRKVKVAGHVEEVLNTLTELNSKKTA